MSVTKRKNKWYCRFQINGERHHYLCDGATSKQQAEQIEASLKFKIMQQQNGVIPKEDKQISFNFLVKTFLEYSLLNKKSYKQDEIRCRLILQYFKPNTKISDIKANDIEKFKTFLVTDNRSKTTANRYLENLSKMFNIAVENDWLNKNPIKKGTRFLVKNYTIRYLTQDEEVRLLKALSGTIKNIVIVALQTGLRRHNLLYLKWSNIDFNFRMIELLENKGNKHIKLYMNDFLFNLLTELYQHRLSDEYVFVNEKTKQPYINIQKTWYKALEKAKIKNFRFHDLRHTVGTRLAQNNVAIPVIKEILAHSSIQTTMRYVHNNSKDIKSAMTLLNSQT